MFPVQRFVCFPRRADGGFALKRDLSERRDLRRYRIGFVRRVGRLPCKQRVAAVFQCVAILFEPFPETGKECGGFQLLRRSVARRIDSVRYAVRGQRGIVVAVLHRASRGQQTDNSARTVENVLAVDCHRADIVAVADDVAVLHSAHDTARVVACRHRSRIVAVGNRDRNRSSVVACRKVSDNAADRAVARSDRADVVAPLDDALSAVAHRADNAAAPSAAKDVRAIPAVDEVRAVAPFCNRAHEGQILRADLSACNADISDDRVRADRSEQTALFGIQVVNCIAPTVKNTVKLCGILSDRRPVRVIAQVDIRRQDKGHVGVRVSFCDLFAKRRQFLRRADPIRIFRRAATAPRRPLGHLDGKRRAERPVKDRYRRIRNRQFFGGGQAVVRHRFGASVAVGCRYHQSRRIETVALGVTDPVGRFRDRDGNGKRLVGIQFRLAANRCNRRGKRRIPTDISPLRLGHCAAGCKRRLQSCLIPCRHGIFCRGNGGLRRRNRLAVRPGHLSAHIVQRAQTVFKPPIGNQRVG